ARRRGGTPARRPGGVACAGAAWRRSGGHLGARAHRRRARNPDVVSERAARFVVALGSGKGGVGKSTVSLHVALALRRRGLNVGLLDADLYGPDIPLMVNLAREAPATRWDFWRGG